VYKIFFAALRLAIAVGLVVSVAWQVLDRINFGIFRPTEYFAYFSIVSALLAALITLVAAWVLINGEQETKLLHISRLSVTAAMIVVGVVYHALLADVASDVRDGDYAWPVLPNELIHTYAPIAIAVDYLASVKSRMLRLRAALWVAAFPLIWLVISIIRGLATNWWPYWFINPNGEGGVGTVLTYVAAITVFFLLLGYLLQTIRISIAKLR
jgi:Co/Zn/Cd efflux system component